MHSLQSPTRLYPLIRTDHHGVPPLSPAYMPDPMELDEHVPVYIVEPKKPEYHAPSDDDIQEHEPEDEDEDPEEDPNKEHEPKDEDTKKEEPSEGSDET
nr:hypothetical protein [Tanacetum cinerariifolium]